MMMFTAMPIVLLVAMLLMVLGLVYLPKKGKIALVLCSVLFLIAGFFSVFLVRSERMVSHGATIAQTSGLTRNVQQGWPAVAMQVDDDAATISLNSPEGTSMSLQASDADGVALSVSPSKPDAVSVPIDSEMDGDADVYPSVRSAAISKSKALFRSLDEVIPNGEKLGRVYVNSNIGDEDINQVISAIKPFVGQADLRVLRWAEGRLELDDPGPGNITLRIVKTGMIGSKQPEPALNLQLIGSGNRQKQAFASVETAPWVENLDAYRQERLNGHEAFVADSGMERSSQNAALRANRKAAVTLLPHVLSQISASNPDVSTSRRSQETWIRKIEQDVSRGRLVVDKFDQRMTKPYGQVYRQFLLVDASDDVLNNVVQAYARDLRGQQTNLKTTIFSGLALVLAIFLMYLFLNVATKGYYAWVLRLLGAVVVVVGIAVLIVVA